MAGLTLEQLADLDVDTWLSCSDPWTWLVAELADVALDLVIAESDALMAEWVTR